MAADAVVALLQTAGGLFNLATSISSTSDANKRNAQLMEFQQALIGLNALVASVQQENATLRGQKDDAEAELKRMKDWGVEQQRYQLVTPYSGVTAFALKKAVSNGESAHYLCANCFGARKRSFLAHSTNKEGWVAIVCAACKYAATTRWRSLGPPKYAEDIQGPDQ